MSCLKRDCKDEIPCLSLCSQFTRDIYFIDTFSCKRQYMSSKWRKLFERSYDIAAALDEHQMNLKHFESLNNTANIDQYPFINPIVFV